VYAILQARSETKEIEVTFHKEWPEGFLLSIKEQVDKVGIYIKDENFMILKEGIHNEIMEG